MANTEYIHQFIQEKLNDLTGPSLVCFYEHGLGLDDELKRTIQVAGHDTSELEEAIKEIRESIVKLKAATSILFL
jgi:hypothetical protein